MSWFKKRIDKELLNEIVSRGWTKDQLELDDVRVWRKGDNFFVSVGDWSKTEPKDIVGAIKYLYEGAKVDYDYEVGSPGTEWDIII